ncbi:tandem-95 repeat protein [Rathayibacter sp. VKM Ac-2759]|uniref:Ig-like domain-containing protein n=1 Tax=Rathayibacter sp. VKM Ac-2759 TaxID=2609252 RepID=UPI001316E2D5|nr:Ig-like domain-containing protein [Rathayibacter sp. VKM Ac-2759]QHC66054.1 tandem-95 repeat protein [Rathayibacter sp. VKM Ac-2759]
MTAAALVVSTMAVLYQGVTTQDVDLNDAGVWVTKPTSLLAGRLNYPSEVLDAGLRTQGTSFDVAQEGGTVVIHDESNATASVVNTSSVTLGEPVPVPADSSVTLGGGVLAILDAATGALWVRAADALSSFSAESDDPTAELGADATATVATDGTVFAYSPADEELVTVRRDGAPSTSTVSGFADGATPAITAVGSTPVLLDARTGAVSIGGADPVQLGATDGLTLQQPSAGGEDVAIATSGALRLQPLDGSAARSVESGGTGTAVAPVRVNGCTYAAWTGSGRYVRDCGGSADDVARDVPNLAGDRQAVFRVNRSAVVLNELTQGVVWLVNRDMKEVSDWEDVTPPDDESEEENESDSSTEQVQNTTPERSAENTPPVAEDDGFGVRAGRSVILPVLDNDTDPDGDVLTASVVGAMPSIGTVEPIYGGGALQITVPAEASGTASFAYTADDGRGRTDDAVVTLTVKPAGSNEAPEQNREGRILLEQGASVSYNVLPDWIDPDGDDLFLRSATPTSDDQVRSTADGLVTFDAIGAELGRKDVVLIVSDGTDDVEGVLHIDVRAPGSTVPVTNPDHVTTLADRTATVAPLGNDLSPTGAPLMLADVEQPAGATVTPDYTAGTFTFSSPTPGSYYLQYLASDGPSSTPGLVRVDVLPASSEARAPVAVRDVALLPAGGTALVDVLQNDSDPNGGLLVVSSVTVEPGTGVAVAILEHEVLRVTDQPGITEPVTFTYTVSNGTGTSFGEVLVVPTPAPATLQPPVATDDSAAVRVGDTVTIDVLANDVSPSGDTLTVVPELVAPLPEAVDGVVFVSEDRVRFRAGDTAKTVYVTYEAIDSSGQKDAGYVSIQILPMNREANSPPRPENLEARTLSGSTISIPIPLDGIDPDGDSVTLVGQASAPGKGRIEEVGADFLTYTAFDASVGTDSFRYEVSDSLGARATATIQVGIAPPSTQNQAPDAVKDVVTAQPGRSIAVDVLANDTDPDGDTLSLVADGVTAPEGVTARLSAGRVLVTTPEAEGDYAIQYTVGDTRGATAIGSLLVTVAEEAALLAPIARDDSVTTAQITTAETVEVPVLKNDEDPDGVASELEVALLGEPAGATVGTGGVVTVVPGDQAQIITYTATDADGLVGTAFLRVPALSATGPALKPGVAPLEVKAGEQATIPLSDWVIAPEGRTARLTQSDRVSALHSADGVFVKDESTLLYTAAPDYFGSDALTFEVTDGAGPDDPAGVKATLSIPITVLPPENQPPTFAGGSMEVAPGEEPSTLDLRTLSSDPDKGDLEKLTYSVSGAPSGITATVSGSVLSVAADESVAKGTQASLDVTVSDGTTPPVQGSVSVRVTASTRPLTVANDDVVAKAPQGRPTTVDVLSNDVNPFPETPLTLVGAPIVDSGAGSASVQGDSVVVTPDADFVGTMTVRYQVGDATGDVERRVFGTIRLTVQGTPAAPGTPSVSSVQDRTVVLSWSDGTNNGAEITTHTVKWSGGSQDCPATTCTITGLTNDREYTFTVTATNEIGESDPSPASAVARPDARPGAPTITSLDYGDGSLTVTWEDGANPGSAVTGYTIQLSGAGNGQVEVPGGTRTKQLTGLTNGANYTVAVRASNRSPEPSDWSGPMSMSPAGSPSAPGAPNVGGSVQLGTQTQLPVNWSPPETVNAEALTGYTLLVKRGGSIVSTNELGANETSQNITLDNSESGYTFSVAAKNKSTDAGKTDPQFSADSAARRAVGNPGAPTIVLATEGDNAITDFEWSAGPGNGAAEGEVAYFYDLNGDGVDRPASPVLTQGISNNNTYTVRLRSIATVEGNAYPSEWSAPTDPLAPYGRVQTPTVSAVGGAKNVTFSWSPPGPNGRAITKMVISVDGGAWEERPAASESRSVGDAYNQAHSIRVKAIDANGDESAEASAQATSGPQPPPVVSASWGGSATPAQGCSSNNCPFVNVDVGNATPGQTYDVVWRCGAAAPAANCGSGNEFHRESRTADGAGNFSIYNKAFFGYTGQVWVTIYGDRGPVQSNTLSR